MKRFADRGLKLPCFFAKFTSYRDPAAHGHGQLPQLNVGQVSSLSGKLFELLGTPCVQSTQWKDVMVPVQELALNLQRYADYLRSTVDRVQKMHALLELPRNPSSGD